MATPASPLRPRSCTPTNHPTAEEAASETGDALTVHTLDEAAAILRVKASWLERRAAGRKIPFTMLGGAYHFTSAHLLAIVRQHEVTPAGQEESADAPRQARRPARPARPNSTPQTTEPLRARPRTGPRRAA